MKVKYKTTIYNKEHPYGYDKTVVVNGEQCEKPSYLYGCGEGYMFIRTEADKIHIIETSRILEIDGDTVNLSKEDKNMLLASEARELVKKSFRKDAVEDAIASIEKKIKNNAERGNRSCIVNFYSYPGGYNEFIQKYGKEHHDDYKHYNVEEEIREYFSKNGFTFKLVTDDICGGVRQDPYWTICW